MWMSHRLFGQACFLITLISGGRADGADATDPPLQLSPRIPFFFKASIYYSTVEKDFCIKKRYNPNAFVIEAFTYQTQLLGIESA